MFALVLIPIQVFGPYLYFGADISGGHDRLRRGAPFLICGANCGTLRRHDSKGPCFVSTISDNAGSCKIRASAMISQDRRIKLRGRTYVREILLFIMGRIYLQQISMACSLVRVVTSCALQSNLLTNAFPFWRMPIG